MYVLVCRLNLQSRVLVLGNCVGLAEMVHDDIHISHKQHDRSMFKSTERQTHYLCETHIVCHNCFPYQCTPYIE